MKPSTAFAAPGIEPRWTASTKEGIGMAYNTSSRVWFTLSHGIIDEIYYPHVDVPNATCISRTRIIESPSQKPWNVFARL